MYGRVPVAEHALQMPGRSLLLRGSRLFDETLDHAGIIKGVDSSQR